MREIVFLQCMQRFDDFANDGAHGCIAQRLVGIQRKIFAEGHAFVKLRHHQRDLADMLELQHFREVGIMRNCQHRSGCVDFLQCLAVADDKQLAIPCEHMVAGLPDLQSGFFAQWRNEHVAIADGISQLRFHGFLQLFVNVCSAYGHSPFSASPCSSLSLGLVGLRSPGIREEISAIVSLNSSERSSRNVPT